MKIEEDQVIEDSEVDESISEVDTTTEEKSPVENVQIDSEEEQEESVSEEEQEIDSEEGQEEGDSEEEEQEDLIVRIEGEEDSQESEEPKEAAPWVKKVRKQNREQAKEIKRLKKQLEGQTENNTPALIKKPTLAACNYDATKYETEMDKYIEQQRAVKEQQEVQQNKWKTKQENYVKLKEQHSSKIKGFEFVEEIVSDSLNETQRGIILQGAEDPAILVYALGKNPKKLQELASITDPVEFAFKIAKLEDKVRISGKKAPAPEKRVKGVSSGGVAGSAEKRLDILREEAAKTGDYTKVTAYKRKLKDKG